MPNPVIGQLAGARRPGLAFVEVGADGKGSGHDDTGDDPADDDVDPRPGQDRR